MSTATAFDAGALEQRYSLLDRLPESLFHAAATHLHGTLRERVEGLLQWHDALLKGALPDTEGLKWPDRPTAEVLLAELAALRLPHFCQGEKTLVEALLLDVLEAASAGILPRSEWQAQLLEQLVKQRPPPVRVKAAESPTGARGQGGPGAAPPRTVPEGSASLEGGEGEAVTPEALDAETLAALEAEAARLAELRVADTLRKKVRSVWEERVRLWAELEDVFGELAMLLGRGWDLTRGMLRSQGWLEVVRLRELLARLPSLRELVRVLGRMQTSEDPSVPPVMESVIGPLRRIFEERREVYSPLARSETRGIERSDDVQRMLPAEAALLGHPKLRLLWHARRAERALLTYRVEGLDFERVQAETEVHESQQRARPAETRGPILICLDTSGSMEGTPEVVAKALVLEAMRVAFAEKRACYLYAFSGPENVAEHALELSEAGLTRLMAFLTQSFAGGTDVTAPLTRAVTRLETQGWGRADLLLVSDGEFEVPASTRELLSRAGTQKGLRSHGLLIGAGEGTAMASICSPVHRFNDWSALLERSDSRPSAPAR